MFRPIEKCARRALVSGSLIVAICAILVMPLAGSTSGSIFERPPNGSKPDIVQRDDPWKNATVKVTRDPFLQEVRFVKPSTPPSPLAGGRSSTGMRITGASVRGLAFGQKPKAVIEVEGATKIVAPGDFIDGSRIVSILLDRIILSDGSVLMFSRRLP